MPTPLRIALGSLLLQAVGLVGMALWLVWLSFTETQASPGAGFAEAAVCVGVAALLAGAAHSLSRRRPGMRGIAVFSQLAWLPIGYFLFQADRGDWGAAAWALGVITAVLLLTRSSREWLGVGLDPDTADGTEAEAGEDAETAR